MDILNPECVWIENRCYRLLPVRDSIKVYEEEVEKVQSSYKGEELEDPNVVIKHMGDKFYAALYVPGPLIGHVRGKEGRKSKILEARFGCTIKFPSRKEVNAEITVFGDTKAAVSSTCAQIMDIVKEFRLKQEFTHFVSFPINSPEIQASFMKFREDILSKYNKTKGIDASIFQKPSKLHVTVSPLVLLDERDKELAEAILTKSIESVQKDIIDKEIIVQVKGIEYMNDDPAEVDVLYAKLYEIDGDTCLQVMADKIMEEFVKANLAKDQYEKVKLHITLMNTRFRSSSDENSQRRVTFDSTQILKEFEDYDFGQITISEAHISIRHTESSNGYYKSSCKRELNQT